MIQRVADGAFMYRPHLWRAYTAEMQGARVYTDRVAAERDLDAGEVLLPIEGGREYVSLGGDGARSGVSGHSDRGGIRG